MFGWILVSCMVMFTTGHPSLFSNGTSVRIIDGTITDIESVPWQVSLQICPITETRNCSHICGGSIISENWILTAAHCVNLEPYFQIIPANKLQIRIGSANNEDGGLMFEISKIVIHENWDLKSIDFDYALLKLNESINFSNNIKPIELPSNNDDEPSDGTLCQVSGWGLTNSNKLDEYLRIVTLPIVNQMECFNSHSSLMKVTSRMICAGHKQGVKGICSGDSGGPLTCKLKNCETQKLIGVVSWGSPDCMKAGSPGVFSRVSAVREWIGHMTGV